MTKRKQDLQDSYDNIEVIVCAYAQSKNTKISYSHVNYVF